MRLAVPPVEESVAEGKRGGAAENCYDGDAAKSAWLDAALDTVLPGLDAVIEDESVHQADFEELARGAGVVVGERKSR